MDITAALAAAPTRTGSRCLLQKHLDSIPRDTDGLDELLLAVESGNWPSARISAVMKRLGLVVRPTTIKDHRRGECSCFLGA